jgi:hypothetical protein
MKLAMWLILFSLAGLIVIFGWVVFFRPYFIAPAPISEVKISNSLIDRMYPKINSVLDEDCYYVQVYLNTGRIKVLKSAKATFFKNQKPEDVIMSYSERPYGVVFITDKSGVIAAQNFVAYRTSCDFSGNGR